VSGGVWRRADGDGPVVVLVHGTMDRSSSLGRVVRHLDGHRVVRYDRRGYGRSIDLGPPERFDQQVDDLLEVIDATSDGAVIVAGHSYGGTIAVAAAERAPHRVAAVVAYESPMPWRDWWPRDSAGARAVASATDPADASEAFMRRMIGDERWERLPPSTRAARRAEGPTLVAEMAHLRPPNPPAHDPSRVLQPLVAAHGSDGAAHHHHTAEVLADEAPAGELVVVDGAGHGIHLSHPERFAGLVRTVAARVRC
jgi:pimeloyl-ACP methyl ester carboxylesterase